MANKVELNPKYQSLFHSDSRYFVITGGRGSGKSFAIGVYLNLLTYEQNTKTLFTRYTMSSAGMSIIPEFLEKLELMGVSTNFDVTKVDIKNKSTDSSIYFSGIKTASGDQTAKLKSIQGVNTFVLDEAEELTDEMGFDRIDYSIRAKGVRNRCILILNPTTKEHWIYQRFFQNRGIPDGFNGTKDGVTYIHTTYLDNIDNLSDSFVNQLEQMKVRRPDKYKHQIMGGWLQRAEGVVFTDWQVGSSNIYDLCVRHAGKNLIVIDSSEPRLISELSTRGLNVTPCMKKKGSILAGIALMQDYNIVIQGENLVKEFNNYVWDVRGVKPRDSYNHGVDSMRYAIEYLLLRTNPKGSYVVS